MRPGLLSLLLAVLLLPLHLQAEESPEQPEAAVSAAQARIDDLERRGAGAALLGVILGALLRGNRRTRREWIN